MGLHLRSLLQRLLHEQDATWQLVRHLLVGGSGVVFNWLVFSLLRHFTPLSTLQTTLCVHGVMLLVIFPMQKFFTFKSRHWDSSQVLKFGVNLSGYVTLDYLLARGFVDVLGLPPFVGKACGLAVLTPLSYLSQRLWVFRRRS